MSIASITVVFDLDGTLVESQKGICESVNHAMRQAGYSVRSEADIIPHIGHSLEYIFTTLTGAAEPDDMVKVYRDHYMSTGSKSTTMYAGIANLLEQLRNANIPMGICTTKRYDAAQMVLDNLGIRGLFGFISGANEGETKADQLKELKRRGIIDDTSIMVGDRNLDIIAAQAVGVKSCGVKWGYANSGELEALKPNYLIQFPSELLTLVKRMIIEYTPASTNRTGATP